MAVVAGLGLLFKENIDSSLIYLVHICLVESRVMAVSCLYYFIMEYIGCLGDAEFFNTVLSASTMSCSIVVFIPITVESLKGTRSSPLPRQLVPGTGINAAKSSMKHICPEPLDVLAA